MNDKSDARAVVFNGLFEKRPCVSAIRTDWVEESFDENSVLVNWTVRVEEPVLLWWWQRLSSDDDQVRYHGGE